MKSELKNTIVVLGMLTMLAACGGGSGDGGSTGNSGGAPGSSYLFYSGLWLGGTSDPDPGFLYAVDPAKPGAPIPVEAGEDAIMGSIATFRVGTYDAATKTISNVHPHAVIYGKTDGRIYRIDASKNGSLAPVQVSNESAAHQMCALHPDRSILLSKGTVVVDSSNPDNSQYVYLLKGADGVCNKWKMVRLGSVKFLV